MMRQASPLLTKMSPSPTLSLGFSAWPGECGSRTLRETGGAASPAVPVVLGARWAISQLPAATGKPP